MAAGTGAVWCPGAHTWLQPLGHHCLMHPPQPPFLPAHHDFLFLRTRPSFHSFAHAIPRCPSFSSLCFPSSYTFCQFIDNVTKPSFIHRPIRAFFSPESPHTSSMDIVLFHGPSHFNLYASHLFSSVTCPTNGKVLEFRAQVLPMVIFLASHPLGNCMVLTRGSAQSQGSGQVC